MLLALVSFKRSAAIDHRAGEGDIRTGLGEMGVYEGLVGEGL